MNQLTPLDESIWTLLLHYQLLKRQYRSDSGVTSEQKIALLEKAGGNATEIRTRLYELMNEEFNNVSEPKTEQ